MLSTWCARKRVTKKKRDAQDLVREEAGYGVLNAALRVGSARGEHQRQYLHFCTIKYLCTTNAPEST